ncbi:MAG: helix-turn-helix domain-containing protein [Clostridia bacterium]|nr:helix-turn-helix domain-containing protein [Clostridia bacterium]
MKISIGTNLKNLRQKKGMTQEGLAELLGVSPQAVSRWENDSAYPDITLLPGLALFFDVSVDALVGMDEIRRGEAVAELHTEIHNLVETGKIEEAIRLARESVKRYPGDTGLLVTLGETLAHAGDAGAVAEAVTLFKRALAMDGVSMKAKATVSANLIFLYLRLGRTEEAAGTVKSLSHVWESREVMLPELAEGEEYAKALGEAIRKVLVYFVMKIELAEGRTAGEIPDYFQLGVDFTPRMSDEELLRRVEVFLKQ